MSRAARCRCTHAEGAHWTDRRGRVNCIYPCGCAEFRPTPDTTPTQPR